MAGAAASAKVSGGIVFVVVVGAGLVALRSRTSLLQAVAAASTAGAVFLLTYAPSGRDAWNALQYMFEFQARHSASGHKVWVNGEAISEPAWWTHLWFRWDGDGAVISIVLLAAMVSALMLRSRFSTWYVLAGTMAPLVVHMAFTVALPHYRFLWMAPQLLLATIGVVALLQHTDSRRYVGAALLSVLLLAAVACLLTFTTEGAKGYEQAAVYIDRAYEATVVVKRASVSRARTNFPSADVVRMFEGLEGEPDFAVIDPYSDARSPEKGDALRNTAQGRGWIRVDIDELGVWAAHEG